MRQHLLTAAITLAVLLALALWDNARLRDDLRDLRAKEKTEGAIDGAIADGIGKHWTDRLGGVFRGQ